MNKPVGYELAKFLKIKGFDIPVRHYRLEGKYTDFIHEGFEDDYWGDNRIVNWNKDNIGIKPFEGFISAPTVADVIMWIYQTYNYWIDVFPTPLNNSDEPPFKVGWVFMILGVGVHIDPDIDRPEEHITYKTPTEAYEAAITYYLNSLIK